MKMSGISRQLAGVLKEKKCHILGGLTRHLIEAKCWARVEALLTNLEFVEAKCQASMTHDLVAEYNAALGSMPELAKERRKECERQKRLEQYAREVAKYARKWSEIRDRQSEAPNVHSLPKYKKIPPPPPPNALGTIATVKKAAKTSMAGIDACATDNRAARIRAFATFVSTHAHQLAPCPEETLPIARNHVGRGAVAKQAEQLLKNRTRPWIARNPRPASELPSRPALVRTLAGHDDDIRSVRVALDGKMALSASTDKHFRIWDLVTGECVLHGRHAGNAGTATMTPNGRMVASYAENVVHVWHLDHGRHDQLCTKGDGEAEPNYLFLPDENHLICVTDVSISFWRLPAGRPFRTVTSRLIPSEAIVVGFGGLMAVSVHAEGRLEVWDLWKAKCLRRLRIGSLPLSVAITPDVRWAVVGALDKTVKLFDLRTGVCIRTLAGHDGQVGAVDMTPDGELAVSGSEDGTLRVWSLATGECLRLLEGHFAVVQCVAVTPDGINVISGGGGPDTSVLLWDLSKQQCPEASPRHYSRCVTAVFMHAKGTPIVSSEMKALRIWDGRTGQSEGLLQGHKESIVSIAVTPDARTLLSSSRDQTLRAWDLRTSTCLYTLEGDNFSTPIALSSDGGYLFRCPVTFDLEVYDVPTGQCVRRTTSGLNRAFALTVTSDSRRVACGDCDGSLVLWDPVTGESMNGLGRHTDAITCLCTLPDSRLLLSGGRDKGIRIWDIETGECLRVLDGHSHDLRSVVVTPDGRRILSVDDGGTIGNWSPRATQQALDLWNTNSPNCLLASMPCAGAVLCGGEDGFVKVWDYTTGRCLAAYPAGAPIRALSHVAPSGRFACGTEDGRVHFLALQHRWQAVPIVTAARLLRFFVPSSRLMRQEYRYWPLFDEGETIPAMYDDNVTAACPWCGQRFTPAGVVLDAIASITRNTGLTPGQSPCLQLPDVAWEEPCLLSKCTRCSGRLRFNPFVVDNRDRH
jgi:WD40 repeat protein